MLCFSGLPECRNSRILSDITFLDFPFFRGTMKTPNKICLCCKVPYRVKPYLLPTSKYCSKLCKNKSNTTKITINCKICGVLFSHISARCNKAKYCSKTCYKKSQIGKGTTIYKCQHCDKSFHSYRRLGRKYCSRSCNGKANSSVWKPKFTTVRKQMIKKNMIKKCEKCGYSKEPSILGVHHIDEDRNNNNLDNLQVLCPNCHSLTHMKHICH